MGILDKVLKVFKKGQEKRYYNAAKINRLTASWNTTNLTSDSILKLQLIQLRARSRDLERNNVYYKRYINLLVQNVVGHAGVRLQSKVTGIQGGDDKTANERIEREWKEWGKKGSCTVCGQYSFKDLQRMVLKSVVRDGEILIRKIKGYPNKWGFALQILEADHLDERLNDEQKNIRMGIRYNEYGQPIEYYLLKKHPGDVGYPGEVIASKYEVIPADEIIYLYMKERPTQSRGIPWGITSATRLNMLDGYEEAELVAARIAASKMGFYKQQMGDEYTGEENEENELLMEVEPGVFEVLPPGVEVETFDPQHPNNAYSFFVKNMLKGIASGLNISYVSLANDLESVNYSSIRAGVLEEREYYKTIQDWFIENFMQPVFEAWLEMSLLTKALPYSYDQYEKLNKPSWIPKRWDWVDPLKDVQANIQAINNNLKSRTQVVAEQGRDFEEVVQELAKEKQMIQELGIMEDSNA